MRVDRWFLTRFSIDNAYGGLCEEFISLEGGPSAWEQQTGRGNPFIATPFGGNANRQLKINAQRIGPLFHGQYLASEGPTVSSVFDFWCMVWQENVERILSVNFPYEERLYPSMYDPSKETIQYWPTEIGETVVYMPFKVTCVNTRMMISPGILAVTPNEMVYRVTQLRISYSNPIGAPQPDRELVHMCYYRWPDGGLPIPWPITMSYATTALRIIDIVDRELPPSTSSLLVHCHAGLGRTGVFIALDVALRQLYQNNTVNIRGVVEKLREKRARAVMNPWQYAYINVVVAEKCGVLSPCLGGHSVRHLIDRLWKDLFDEVHRQFQGNMLTYTPELLCVC
uniref:Protein-tyrosine phosphatase n=1 Tax=Angiostrongylus cantonensis TaxID=6313 RepID=A0A0K0DFN7_ANGCA